MLEIGFIMFYLCHISVDHNKNIDYIMYNMNSTPIVNHSELLSQDGRKISHPYDGLRLLGRIIARQLLTKCSAHTKKNNATANNPQTLVDS